MPMPQPPFNSPIQTQPTIKGVVSIVNVWQNWLQLAQIYLANLTGSGPTSARPTNNLWVGQPFFDTTLVKQVIWNGSAWIDNGGSGTVTAVTGTAPISSTGGTTPDISITQANSTTNGYLSSTDWNTFNSKVSSVSGTAPVVSSGGSTPVISMAQASASANGWLSSADWDTFNGKQSQIVVNVRDYYQSGDSNWNPAISRALSALSATGGVVFFPAGYVYTISSTITISTGGITLAGGGKTSWIYQTTNSTTIINVTSADFSIIGLRISYATQGVSGAIAVLTNQSGGLYENVTIEKAYNAFDCGGTFNTSIFNNITLKNYTNSGFYLHDGSQNATVTNFFFLCDNTTSYGLSGAIYMSNQSQGHTFANGQTYQGAYALLTTATTWAIGSCPAFNYFTNVYFDSATNGAVIGNSCLLFFNGCWFSNRPNSGAYITNSSGISFVGGGAYNCGQDGISVASGCVDITFSGFVSLFNGRAGIELNNAAGVLIDSCILGDSTGKMGANPYGVIVSSGCSSFVVTNNQLYNGPGTQSMVDGTSASTDKTITGNIGYPDQCTYASVSRSFNTNITNSNNKPMFVSVWGVASGTAGISMWLGGTGVGTGTSLTASSGPTGTAIFANGIVPPQTTYRIELSGSLTGGVGWTEMILP
jgi:hypothetical protein